MKNTLLSIFLLACCSVANAQWQHLADLRVPQLYPSYGQTCFGQSVWGYNYNPDYSTHIFLSTDQGQSFIPFPLSGLPNQNFSAYDNRLYRYPDYYLTMQGSQMYRLLPDKQVWEPLGTPIDTTPGTYFSFVARQGEKFIFSNSTYVLDTITSEWTEIYKEYRSFDEGNTWSLNETGLPGFRFAWSTVLDSVVLAQNGARDSTYFSTDGGVTWHAVTYPPSLCQALNITNRSGSNLLAQDTCQHLYFSLDDGKTWGMPSGLDSLQFIDWGSGLSFYGQLFQSGDKVIIIPSSHDSLYRSIDQGATWTSLPLNLYDSFNNGSSPTIVTTPNGTLLYWAAPELYASTDAGDTWTKVLSTPDLDLAICDCPPQLQVTDSLAYLMGDGGFFVSTDQGLTWTDRTQTSPHVVTRIVGISAKGPLLVAQKESGYCNTYVSNDSGVTWKKSPACCVEFALNTPQGIFACTHGGVYYEGTGPFSLFKSIDQGVTWKGVPVEKEGELQFMQPAGDKLLVMGPAIQVADPTRLMVSDLQGESWSLSSNGIEPGTHLSCAAYDSITGKIYSAVRFYSGGIYVSSDQGQTWNISAVDLKVASMVAENGNICAMGSSKVYLSHDSGANWKTVADTILAVNGSAANALVLADGNLVMGGNSVFISRDWGETWAPFTEGLPPGTVAYDLVRDDQYLYTASLGLGIYRRPISDLISSTHPEAAVVPALEVYPNPSASGVFQVKADLAGEQPLQLFVMDASGKTIWHGVGSGGRQSINLSAAPAGVYWLRVVSDKETAVRKLVKAGK